MHLTGQISTICHDMRVTRDTLMKKHPSWALPADARIGTFSRYINILESTRLGLIFEEGYLMSRSWWAEYVTSAQALSDVDISTYILEFDRSQRIGFTHEQFSMIETFLRTIMREINPGFLAKDDNFANICSWLFKHLNLQNKEYEELIKLLRLSRNTIHNNGVYYHKSGKDDSVVYKGQTYNFIQGKATMFGIWPFHFSLVSDITRMMMSVVESNEVASLASLEDAFAVSVPTIPIYNLHP